MGQPEKACDIYEKHVKARNSISAGHVRRHALIDACCKKCLMNAAIQCDHVDLAASLLEAAPADVAKHISMIRNCTSRGNLGDAMSTFRELKESGAELTHSLWNTMLDAGVECYDLKCAEALMKEMEIAGVADVIALLVMQLEVFLALPAILQMPSA